MKPRAHVDRYFPEQHGLEKLKGRASMHAESDLGAVICQKIKNLFYADVPFPECYMKVADQFSLLKRIAMKFFGDKTKYEVVIILSKYSQNDIKDFFNHMEPENEQMEKTGDTSTERRLVGAIAGLQG